MKLAYKNEQDIIDHASGIDDRDVCFYPAESALSHRFLASLRGENLVQRERPDFEDHTAHVLLEAMIVDDHPRPGKKDKTRARQAQMLTELEAAGLPVHPDARAVAIANSELATDKDHNYRAYTGHFTNTVLKHAKNSATYRNKRPGYQLGFLVFDESTAYIEGAVASGAVTPGRPHCWFADPVFIDAIRRSGANCFVWMTPYKYLETADAGVLALPAMTIIDVSLLEHAQHIAYDDGSMISAEA